MVADRAPAGDALSARATTASAGSPRWTSAWSRACPTAEQRLELLRAVHYEATRARLDPQLVLGVIEVESGFRKYAVSRAGARGYMQVMPFWVQLIGQPSHNLFHLRTNLAYGCAILRHYLDIEKGDYFRALGRYNGTPRASPSTRTWCSRRGAGAGSTTVRRHEAARDDRRPARAQSALRQLALGLHAAGARHHGAGPPARVHRADPAGLALRRRRSLILLVGSINYALALGFALTFLLAGLGARRHGAHRAQPRAHRGQRRPRRAGVRRRVGAVPPLPRRPRRATTGPRSSRATSARARSWWSTSRPAALAEVVLAVPARRRGWLPLGARAARDALSARPVPRLELHRARRALPGLSAPERSPLPPLARRGGGAARCARPRRAATTSPACATYQLSDSPRHVAWKAVARSDELLTKQFTGEAAAELWLDWRLLPATAGLEQRLSRLAGWVLAAERAGAHYGLRLPGVEIAPGRGDAPRRLPAGARALRTEMKSAAAHPLAPEARARRPRATWPGSSARCLVVIAPHATRAPWWLTLLTLCLFAWRIYYALNRAPLPSRWLVLAVAGVGDARRMGRVPHALRPPARDHAADAVRGPESCSRRATHRDAAARRLPRLLPDRHQLPLHADHPDGASPWRWRCSPSPPR